MFWIWCFGMRSLKTSNLTPKTNFEFCKVSAIRQNVWSGHDWKDWKINVLEIGLQFRTTEILQNFCPIRGFVKTAEIGLELRGQDLESGGFTDTVGSDETEHLTGAGIRQSMKLERVRTISMRRHGRQILGQIDNVNSLKRAFFNANTATDAQILWDPGHFGILGNLYTKLASADDRAEFLALLAAFLGLAAIAVDDGNTQLGLIRGLILLALLTHFCEKIPQLLNFPITKRLLTNLFDQILTSQIDFISIISLLFSRILLNM